MSPMMWFFIGVGIGLVVGVIAGVIGTVVIAALLDDDDNPHDECDCYSADSSMIAEHSEDPFPDLRP